MNEKEQLEYLSKVTLPRARRQFEMEVESTAAEIIEIGKQISSAIGEVSITEAKQAIVREFEKRLSEIRYYEEFKGKK